MKKETKIQIVFALAIALVSGFVTWGVVRYEDEAFRQIGDAPIQMVSAINHLNGLEHGLCRPGYVFPIPYGYKAKCFVNPDMRDHEVRDYVESVQIVLYHAVGDAERNAYRIGNIDLRFDRQKKIQEVAYHREGLVYR